METLSLTWKYPRGIVGFRLAENGPGCAAPSMKTKGDEAGGA
ncbi:hypothetical protein [Paracidovorax anthurii]|nr:hypothetical protein [Paracidovorax anthurii]